MSANKRNLILQSRNLSSHTETKTRYILSAHSSDPYGKDRVLVIGFFINKSRAAEEFAALKESDGSSNDNFVDVKIPATNDSISDLAYIKEVEAAFLNAIDATEKREKQEFLHQQEWMKFHETLHTVQEHADF